MRNLTHCIIKYSDTYRHAHGPKSTENTSYGFKIDKRMILVYKNVYIRDHAGCSSRPNTTILDHPSSEHRMDWLINGKQAFRTNKLADGDTPDVDM